MNLWVFDNDGTLYDDHKTREQFTKISNSYFAKLLRIPPEELKDKMITLKKRWDTESSSVAFMKEYGLNFEKIINDTYLKINLNECIPPDSNNTLQKILTTLQGEKVVFTNNPSEFARRILSRVGLINYFNDIIGIEETGFYGKPSPHAFEVVEKRYPHHKKIVFCDNSLKNLDAAQERGWVTVWYNPTGVDNDKGGKHFIVRSLETLIDIF